MKRNRSIILFGVFISMLLLVCGMKGRTAVADQTKVSLLRTPNEGIQPQAIVDDTGVVHVIYFKGNPAAGDIFYVRKAPQDETFSKPIQVNSQPGSAIATGNVRGAHIAVGKGGRVHVAWMGSKESGPKGPANSTPMLYTRMNDARTAFEPQRNVMQFAVGLDGGGSVAADRAGHVYVAWHAGAGAKGEAARRVWVARSKDEGKTFARELPASDQTVGACGCCGMRAFAAQDGTLYMLYRAAAGGVDRDMYFLASKNGGASFQGTPVHKWKLEACPMSTAAIAESHNSVMTAWETKGQVYYSTVDRNTLKVSEPIAAPGEGVRRKHPAVIGNAQDETILIWTEGMGWKQGGTLAWQVFDKAGQPIGDRGHAEGVPAWSLVTAYARPDGGFTIIY